MISTEEKAQIEQERDLAASKGFIMKPDPYTWHVFTKVIKYQDGSLYVWRDRDGWQTAYSVYGQFIGHKKFTTLEEALARDS